MNPWTAILESVHSSLIDELTERHPEPKPELGLPVRDREFRVPDRTLATILACEAQVGEQRGTVFLATDVGFSKVLGIKESDLWTALLKRAGSEFARRSVKPVIMPPVFILVKAGVATLPTHLNPPGRVVWIPFKLPGGVCYLGLAV